MRKGLTILGLFLIIGFVLSELFLPALGAGAVRAALQTPLQTDDVTVEAGARPALRMLMGRIDEIDIAARGARLGALSVAELTLHGEGVAMPPDALLRRRFAVTDADRLELSGIVTAEAVADFLARQTEKLEDTQVTVTRELVSADAVVKMMGLPARVHIEGVFLTENNRLFFRVTNVKIKKAFFGRDLTADFAEPIELYDFSRLHMPVELDGAVQEDGRVVLKASRHPGRVYGDGAPRKGERQ